MKEGWKCPVCHAGVDPDRDTCEHTSQRINSAPNITPDIPHPIQVPTCWPATIKEPHGSWSVKPNDDIIYTTC